MRCAGVYREKSPKEHVKYYLQLQESKDGIILCAVDEDGDRIAAGHILRIDNSGRLYRSSNVSRYLELDLTKEGRMIIYDAD